MCPSTRTVPASKDSNSTRRKFGSTCWDDHCISHADRRNKYAIGHKSASTGRRGVGGGSGCVDQAPGWDGQVADITRFAIGEIPVVATVTKNVSHGGSPTGDECDKKRASGAVSETMYTLCDGGKSPCGAGNHVIDREALTADAATKIEKRNAAVEIPDVLLSARSPSREDDWTNSPTALRSVLEAEAAAAEEEKEQELEAQEEGEEEADEANEAEQQHGVYFEDSDEDTAAADDDSAEVDGDSAGESTARDATGNLEGHCLATDSGLLESAHDTDDTTSELSCSTSFSVLSAANDDEGSEKQLRAETAINSSGEYSNQARMTASDDDDDISSSHVEHLIQARRRWQLRAIESEYELASIRSLDVRVERGGARAMHPPLALSSKYQDPTRLMQDSGSFSEPPLSEPSVVEEAGFDLDNQSQTTSRIEGAVPTPSFSACVLHDGETISPLGFLDTAGEAQFLRSTSNTIDRFQANEAPYDAASYRKDRSASPVKGDELGGILSDDGQGKGGAYRQLDADYSERGAAGSDNHDIFRDDIDDEEQCRNGTDSNRLRQEIVELKKKLRQAELRHAAAEATAASVLQRARAAELARDVKEIKVGGGYQKSYEVRRETCVFPRRLYL